MGCSRTETESGVTPDDTCRLQTKTYTQATASGSFPLSSATSYTYNSAGNQVNVVESYNDDGLKYTFRTDYQYNGDGFLTQKVQTTTRQSGETKSTDTYQYESSRLVKETSVSGSSTRTNTYIYDAGGKLAKQVYTSGSSVTTYDFTNGVLTAKESKEGSKTYPATVVNGRITREFGFNFGTGDRFIGSEYNAAGQRTKASIVDTQDKVDYTLLPVSLYEYEAQVLKDVSQPVFKGHPTLEIYGQPGTLRRQTENYGTNTTTTDFVYKSNSKVYTTEQAFTTKGGSTNRQRVTKYTYSNCQ